MESTEVLYISYDGLTDNLGLSQILPYLIQISKKEFKFHIVSCEKKSNYLVNKDIVTSLISKNQIQWYHVWYTKSPPVLSTIKDLNGLRKLSSRILTRTNIKIVHSRSYPAMFVAHQLKKKFNFKIVFDIRGFYLEERFDGNIWSRKNPIHRLIYHLLKKKEIQFFNTASAVVTLTESSLQIIRDKFNKKANSISVIPCCTDFQLFKPGLKKFNNFNLLYLGSIGTWYLLDEMLDFFNQLLLLVPNATFTFATHDHPASITDRCSEKNIPIERIRIHPSTRNELPELITQADLAIFFIKKVYSKIASSPTKMGELLACGIPLVCNKGVGDIDYLNELFPFIYTIDPFNISQEEVKNIVTQSKIFNKEEIRIHSQSYFDLEVGVQKYINVYRQIL